MSKDKVNLYDCGSLFAETMHGRFPDGCPEGSAISFAVTDGSRMSSIIDGEDNLVKDIISNLCLDDEEVMGIVGDGLLAAMRYKQEQMK